MTRSSLSEMELECGLKLNGIHQLLRRTLDSLTSSLLPPFHIQCPEHYTLTEYHFQPPLSPNELLGWNSRLSLRPCNVLHISKPIYLHGHFHIFIQSLSHQALHHSMFNQDSNLQTDQWAVNDAIVQTPSSERFRERKFKGYGKRDRSENKNYSGKSRSRKRIGEEAESARWKHQRGERRGGRVRNSEENGRAWL